MIIKYYANGDHAGLFLGLAFSLLAIFNTLTGTLILHAVVRRLVAEARKESGTE